MSYIPTFATRYLKDCAEEDMDPRRSLDGWMMQQQRRQGREGDGVDEDSARAGMDRGCIFPSRNSLPTVPRTPFKTHSSAPTSRKDTEPFINQTSAIFHELIGGHATGEIEEEEEEQDDRKVHGFVYTRQGKRKIVFRGELPEHKSMPIQIPKPEESLTVLLPQMPKRQERMVRTYKVPRVRLREKTVSTTQEQEISCKLCATYTQLRSCEVLRAAVPDIPVKCGPCLRMEMRRRRTMGEKSSGETMPIPRLRLVMKKEPPEAPAGNDQMALQMLADVQRCPKRVRSVPGGC